MKAIQFKTIEPSWSYAKIQKHELTDEVDLLQLGQTKQLFFEQTGFDMPQASLSNAWPTKEEPGNQFKFISIWLEIDQDLTTIERSTYSLLEWVGDIGGLFDGLLYLCGYLISPFAGMSMRAMLTSEAFKTEKTNSESLKQ